jgi:hypothetical protein
MALWISLIKLTGDPGLGRQQTPYIHLPAYLYGRLLHKAPFTYENLRFSQAIRPAALQVPLKEFLEAFPKILRV